MSSYRNSDPRPPIMQGSPPQLIPPRMRAQANFIENTPIFLILFGLIELAGKGGWWLPVVGAIFMLGRVTHAFGMDGNFKAGRPIGTLSAYLGQIGLGMVAVLVATGRI